MINNNHKTLMFLITILCTVGCAGENFIDWHQLKNPVYQHQNWSTKDACMACSKDNDTFYLFFSAFYHDRDRVRSHVVGIKTKDFKNFSDPLFIWDGRKDGWIGMCSPDITKIHGTYYLTYNSWGDKEGKPNQLFYASSKDLETWQKHIPLAKDITTGTRAIDAALAYENKRYYLVWKEKQSPNIAYSENVQGPWKRLGTLNLGWFENAEFIKINDKWHLLATAANGQHSPHMACLKRSAQNPEHWTKWHKFRKLKIPAEEFNSQQTANAAFLADWTDHDGYFYMIYAGRTEDKSHAGRGNNKLGLARSKNLVKWQIP